MYYRINAAGVIVSVNQQSAAYLNCTPDELVGRLFWDTISPGDRDRVHTLLDELFTPAVATSCACSNLQIADAPPTWIFSQIGDDGATHPIQAIALLTPAALPAGDRSFALPISLPTSKQSSPSFEAILLCQPDNPQQQTHDLLPSDCAVFWQMFEAQSTIQLLIDLQTGKIVDANTAATAFYRYPRPSLQQLYLSDLSALPDGEVEQQLQRLVTQSQQVWQDEHRLATGDRRIVESHCSLLQLDNRPIVYAIIHDVSDRCRTEQALQHNEALFRGMFEQAAVGLAYVSLSGHWLKLNPELCRLLGYTADELVHQPVQSYVVAEPYSVQTTLMQQWLDQQQTTFKAELQFLCKNQSRLWVSLTRSLTYTEQGQPHQFVCVVTDISDRKAAESALNLQLQKERLISLIAEHVRRSLDLKVILQTTVDEVRKCLNADRVFIYRLSSDGLSGSVMVESCLGHVPSMLGWSIGESSFPQHRYLQPFTRGQYRAIADIDTSTKLDPAYRELLQSFAVKSHLAIPILQKPTHRAEPPSLRHPPFAPSSEELGYGTPQSLRIWGLLVVHQCDAVHHWNYWEIDLLRRLEKHLSVAIQQSSLYTQLCQFNETLETQVQQRTNQLRQTMGFEALLRRITEKIRDSLDESVIWQTAVHELALVFNAESCTATLYDLDQRTATVSYEHAPRAPLYRSALVQMERFPQLYDLLLNKESLQFCPLVGEVLQPYCSVLVCPIFDNQGVLGDLWLSHQQTYSYSLPEVLLVQQVAAQCAIALRQSRLYQTSQQQLKELEKLNLLKDDFLSTISHELRTPMSSIKMAAQLLTVMLAEPSDNAARHPPNPQSNKVQQCLRILQEECDREISLINDLLTLQHLEAGTQPFVASTVRLQDWVPQVAETFLDLVTTHQQTLTVSIPIDLPPIITDLHMFNRILGELLTNAYKFTPAGGAIKITVTPINPSPEDAPNHLQAQPAGVQLHITNTGVEISADERQHIFNKFYRVPSHDPWKHGGTGLGLALVQKLVTYLGGTVQADSSAGQTTFTVYLPQQSNKSLSPT